MDHAIVPIEHDEPVLDTFDDRIGLGALVIEFEESRFVAAQTFLLQGLKPIDDSFQLGRRRDLGVIWRSRSSKRFDELLDRAHYLPTTGDECRDGDGGN